MDIKLDGISDREAELLGGILLDRDQRFGKDLSRFPPLAPNDLVVFGKIMEERQDILACQVPLLSPFLLLGGFLFLFFFLRRRFNFDRFPLQTSEP